MDDNSNNLYIVIGLGNPEACHENNRHNIGHLFIDYLKEKYATIPLNDYQKKFSSLVAPIKIGDHKIILLKPQTYMNLSGNAASKIKQFYKINNKDIIVIHDELDLNFFVIKNKLGGGDAGHNGLKDISKKIGKDYHRIRIGIGHPRNLANYSQDVSHYVLENFNNSEKESLNKIYAEAEKHLTSILAENK